MPLFSACPSGPSETPVAKQKKGQIQFEAKDQKRSIDDNTTHNTHARTCGHAVDDAAVHLEAALGHVGRAHKQGDGDAPVDHLAADVLPECRVGLWAAQVLEDGLAQLLQDLALLHADHLYG